MQRAFPRCDRFWQNVKIRHTARKLRVRLFMPWQLEWHQISLKSASKWEFKMASFFLFFFKFHSVKLQTDCSRARNGVELYLSFIFLSCVQASQIPRSTRRWPCYLHLHSAIFSSGIIRHSFLFLCFFLFLKLWTFPSLIPCYKQPVVGK